MRGAAGLLLITGLWSQDTAPVGMVRGTLLECDLLSAASSSGSLSLRTPENKVYRFTFDSKTYFEREKRRVLPVRLRPGDPLEIVSDRGESPALRYARIVHVLDDAPAVRFSSYIERLKQYRSATEHIMPRGTLTYAGLIARLDGDVMILRVRGGGETRILLRPDTRYLHGGNTVGSSALSLSTRVFVRAGRNLDDEIEAYQVVWGEILSPRVLY
jgi:hypothetical protein